MQTKFTFLSEPAYSTGFSYIFLSVIGSRLETSKKARARAGSKWGARAHGAMGLYLLLLSRARLGIRQCKGTKMTTPLAFCRGMSWPETGTVTKTCDKTCDEHASRPCDCLCVALFFPFSRPRLRYFVFSGLDFDEFKCFHDSIYWNLEELSLFILNVNEHNFDLP